MAPALFVIITDYNNFPDCPCLLKTGDHPFIIKKSSVNYPRAKEWKVERIKGAVAGNLLKAQAEMPHHVLQRMIQGALDSGDIPEKILKYYGLI